MGAVSCYPRPANDAAQFVAVQTSPGVIVVPKGLSIGDVVDQLVLI
jgi:hypothetical protein